MRRNRGDDGQIGGIEGVAFGVLIFVLGILVVANAWAVIDAKTAASAAAREAARSIVESSGTRAEAIAEARAIADETLHGYGRSLGERGRFVPEQVDFRRCGRVAVRVEYDVPLVAVPVISQRTKGFTAVGRHAEIVDPFRSGLDDRSACPADLAP